MTQVTFMYVVIHKTIFSIHAVLVTVVLDSDHILGTLGTSKDTHDP